MSEKLPQAELKTPAVELDTLMPEPHTIGELPKFLFSSPSFRVVFYGTTLSLSLAFAASAMVYFEVIGPDQTHNPVLNGTAQKYFPELKADW
jgi:hypothetical protein